VHFTFSGATMVPRRPGITGTPYSRLAPRRRLRERACGVVSHHCPPPFSSPTLLSRPLMSTTSSTSARHNFVAAEARCRGSPCSRSTTTSRCRPCCPATALLPPSRPHPSLVIGFMSVTPLAYAFLSRARSSGTQVLRVISGTTVLLTL
jgi:hypothetical protein